MGYKIIIGIYKIQSLLEQDRIYIGSSINIKNRSAALTRMENKLIEMLIIDIEERRKVA